MQAFLGFLLVFTLLTIFFSALERLFPSIPGQKRWRRGVRTDLIYWLVTPLIFKPIGRAITGVALFVLAVLLQGGHDRASIVAWIQQGHGPLGRLPSGLQGLLALLTADFVGYWAHRAFHGQRLWRFHAVHHSSVDLDWLASVRVHPVNEFANGTMHAVVLVGLGFRPQVLAGVIPFFTAYAILLHANVSWSFGPLKYLFASPVFHRWHHTSQAEGLDKNFAGLFPLWDILFGTFYMPKDRMPMHFGVIDMHVPEGFGKQLLWPFRSSPKPSR
jgi:sterol desaturase/sphingolipid hydroxylase (fatty acid hydroxylase superfamily)